MKREERRIKIRIGTKRSLIAFFEEEPNGEDDGDADEGHEESGAGEVGRDNHDDATDHWDPGVLFLAIDEVAETDRTPKEGGEEEARIEHIFNRRGGAGGIRKGETANRRIMDIGLLSKWGCNCGITQDN